MSQQVQWFRWLALACFLYAAPVQAHPHVFVDASTAVVFDDEGKIAGVHNDWTFDEVYSSWIIEGLDPEQTNKITPAMLRQFADNSMLNLADYDYFTTVGYQHADIALLGGSKATASYTDGRITLSFYDPVATPFTVQGSVDVGISDPQYYVAITMADRDGLSLANAPANCSIDAKPPKDLPDDLAAKLYTIPANVTKIPADLQAELRPYQGGVLVTCGRALPAAQAAAPATALDAIAAFSDGTLPASSPVTSAPTAALAETRPQAPIAASLNQPHVPVATTAEPAAVPAPVPPTAPARLPPFADRTTGSFLGGPPVEPGFILPRTGPLGVIAKLQSDFYQQMTALLGSVKTNCNAAWLLGGLSFLYGIFHAAGPGHGKVVIGSYLLANERQLRRGIGLSLAAAMMQSVVAVVFVGIAAALLGLSSMTMGITIAWMETISYAFVALLGLWLVAKLIFGWGHHHAHDVPKEHQRAATGPGHALLRTPVPEFVFSSPVQTMAVAGVDKYGRLAGDPHFGHDHGSDEHEHGHKHVVTPKDAVGTLQEQLAVVIGVGLRPCSGALVVLVFALSQQIFAIGVASVLLMGLGTAITVASLAWIAVSAKGLAQRWLRTREGMAGAVLWWAELLGASIVFAFGATLLAATFPL